ncbi:MAG: hypothetical protein M1818_006557 [Claussenomyces sp. TS43310]|nr:MAG: hypothetical protein M1818_006557 [Claussenomyces sp. TS43310]
MAPSTKSYHELFVEARALAPTGLPEDSWYIIVAATLLTTEGGAHLGELYLFLIAALGDEGTLEARRRISRRIRAVIIKAWTLVGMPRASDGFFSLTKVEKVEDVDMNGDRQRYAADPELAMRRTKAWWAQVFGEQESSTILDSYSTNPDFGWTVDYAVYGLFLADLSVLGPEENELVILSSVMGQGAHFTTITHLRGIRRIGVSAADTQSVENIIRLVAEHQGKDTSSWHQSQEVAHLFP